MKEHDETDRELDALLVETVAGLRKRINSDDSNASDYQAATKLLALTGRLDDVREAAEKRSASERMQNLSVQFDDLPSFNSDGMVDTPLETEGQTRQ